MKNMKKKVHYFKLGNLLRVGKVAFIGTVDHPSPFVTNNGDGWVRTSPITRIRRITGEFWTENTHYIPTEQYRINYELRVVPNKSLIKERNISKT